MNKDTKLVNALWGLFYFTVLNIPAVIMLLGVFVWKWPHVR